MIAKSSKPHTSHNYYKNQRNSVQPSPSQSTMSLKAGLHQYTSHMPTTARESKKSQPPSTTPSTGGTTTPNPSEKA